MAAASSITPPEPMKHRRHIPVEILEEILVNLEVKSLLRFSSVSKSWLSTIFEPGFVKKYCLRAALPGRVGLIVEGPDILARVYSYGPLSDILSDNPTGMTVGRHHMIAFCQELCCIEDRFTNSLLLWNPSMKTYRKLPHSLMLGSNECFYGVGYDSVNDDYKILQVQYGSLVNSGLLHIVRARLYSLRSDSWKNVETPLETVNQPLFRPRWCLSVSGALHWLANEPCRWVRDSIVSFDLSTEKYGEVMVPTITNAPLYYGMGLAAEMGKLCLIGSCFNPERVNSIDLWVMEDYGVVESWTKKFAIDCRSVPELSNGHYFLWKPLCCCDDGGFVLGVTSCSEDDGSDGIYVYTHGKLTLRKKLHRSITIAGLVFVQSLVSLATWPNTITARPSC